MLFFFKTFIFFSSDANLNQVYEIRQSQSVDRGYESAPDNSAYQLAAHKQGIRFIIFEIPCFITISGNYSYRCRSFQKCNEHSMHDCNHFS